MSNNKQSTQNKKVYKGNEAPSESLVQDTLKLVENECKTNNQIFVIRNIISLMGNGLEANIRSIIRVLKENGKNTRVVVKDDKTDFEYQKSFGIPASNIGYLFGPISKGIWKNNIPIDTVTEFQTKTSLLLKDLKETEQLGIDIIVKNNVGTKDIPSEILRKKIATAKEKYQREKISEEEKAKLEEERLAKKREKNKKLREKQKAKRELRKKNLIAFLETNPQATDKTLEEWEAFANENKIKIAETYDSQEAIFKDIIEFANKVIGDTSTNAIQSNNEEEANHNDVLHDDFIKIAHKSEDKQEASDS